MRQLAGNLLTGRRDHMFDHWLTRLRQFPQGAVPVLLFRALVVLAGVVWFLLGPAQVQSPHLLAVALGVFTLSGVLLFLVAWRRPGAVMRWNLLVLVLDVLVALTVIHLTGGMRSTFFLAFYVIAAVQAYYYGTGHGLLVAFVMTGLYVGVIWPTLDRERVADLALRASLLLLTAGGLGVVGGLQRNERREIRALNAELQARERFVQDVLASIQDGVVVLDVERRVSAWNRTMEAVAGAPAAATVGRAAAAAAPWLDGPRLRTELDRVYAGGQQGFVLEPVEVTAPNGEGRILALKGHAVRGPDGAFQGVALFVEDVTRRVALDRSLRQTERLAGLGTLAAGLAHEVNNPISVIASRAELLLEEADTLALPPPVREDLGVMRTHAQRIARITHALLTFARQRGGDQVAVDLNQVVEETLALFATPVRLDGITLRTTLAAGLPPVPGDPVLLGQVVLDLVTNAREALTGRGGEIVVETAPEAGSVRLTVRDSGPGIAPDQLPRVFEPFFTTKANGSGLGLPVCYGIVREHGGQIDIESQPGAGTTVVVRLPGGKRNGGP